MAQGGAVAGLRSTRPDGRGSVWSTSAFVMAVFHERDWIRSDLPPPCVKLSKPTGSGDTLARSLIGDKEDLRLNLLRVGVTQSFATDLWGGTSALNPTTPYVNPELTWTAVTPPLDCAAIDDTTSGIGDLSFTGLVGWHRGNLHYSSGLTIYAPTGSRP